MDIAVEANLSKSVKYDPNQPRVPAGNSEGGQCTEKGRFEKYQFTRKSPEMLIIHTNNIMLDSEIYGESPIKVISDLIAMWKKLDEFMLKTKCFNLSCGEPKLCKIVWFYKLSILKN
jgi:hypothetical protein